jgi:hypothetical protein
MSGLSQVLCYGDWQLANTAIVRISETYSVRIYDREGIQANQLVKQLITETGKGLDAGERSGEVITYKIVTSQHCNTHELVSPPHPVLPQKCKI